MRTSKGRSLVFAIALMAICTGSALADVQMTLMGQVNPTGMSMGGVYTSPYRLSIGGSSVAALLMCDDFATNISPGQTWTATTTSISDILNANTPVTTVKFDTGNMAKQQRDYATVAVLAAQLMALQDFGSQEAGILSYASWSVFDDALYNGLKNNGSTGHGSLQMAQVSLVEERVTNAQAMADQAISSGNLAAIPYITIYTPEDTNSSQEFIGVPEPTAIGLLALNVLLVAAGIFRARTRVRA